MKNAAWIADFAKEIKAFPYGAHDNQVDALVQLLTEFDKGTFASSTESYIVESAFGDYSDDVEDLYHGLLDDFKKENPNWL